MGGNKGGSVSRELQNSSVLIHSTVRSKTSGVDSHCVPRVIPTSMTEKHHTRLLLVDAHHCVFLMHICVKAAS